MKLTMYKNIVPVIDRGMFHNYVHMCKQLFLCDVSEAVTVYWHLFHMSFFPFYKRVEEKGKK